MDYSKLFDSLWLEPALLLGIAILSGLGIHFLMLAVARSLASRTSSSLDDIAIRHLARPMRFLMPILVVLLALPFVSQLAPFSWLRHALGLMLIACSGWFLIAVVDAVVAHLKSTYRTDVEDNLAARRIHTQIRILRRIAVIVVGVMTLAVMLMTFPDIRQVGTTLFASAGLAGIIAGLAARPAIGNLIAGLQVALTSPIRLDDVVIIDGEWGKIEEINTTFVVVRIWDLRRLVVPLSYFIENPFQNWTRTTADLIGTVFLYTDYTIPVETVRERLHEILKHSGLWDGRVWALQVTNATERSLELRAIMSAPDSSRAWELRCHVRERLVDFLQQEYPESLPRSRAQITAFESLSREGGFG